MDYPPTKYSIWLDKINWAPTLLIIINWIAYSLDETSRAAFICRPFFISNW